jgi:hypothetical protein
MDDKLKHILNESQDHLKNITEKVKSATGIVANHPKTKAAMDKTKQFCDEKGITEKAIKVGSKINYGKKTFTGEKASEDVNKFLNLQNCYNDLLATKLEEALQRIEVLKQRLDKVD